MRGKIILMTIMLGGLSCYSPVFGQQIPNDPNSLPQMIGNRDSSNSRVKNPITIFGKVFIDGLSSSQERPIIYVSAFSYGRFVEKRQVSPSGSYTINGLPRDGLTLSFEIDGVEVANYQIMTPISDTVSQDANISLLQIQNAKNKTGVVAANSLYQRSNENQKLFEKALEQIKLKKNNEAVSLLKEVIKNDEKDFVAWTQLGDVLFSQEKNDDAEKSYQEALRQNPKFVTAMINLGRVYLVKNNGEKAIETLTKAVEDQPTSPDANYFLGEAYLFIKKGSKAVGYLNEAIRLDPVGKADAHLRLAALYNGANLKDKAAQEYKLFLEKVPNYKEKEKLEKYIKENLPK